jgi:hypothetical protein
MISLVRKYEDSILDVIPDVSPKDQARVRELLSRFDDGDLLMTMLGVKLEEDKSRDGGDRASFIS